MNQQKWRVFALSFVCILIVLAPLQAAIAESSGASVNVVPSQNAAKVGETLTVNITVSNVQNLYGIDLTLDWNSSVLKLIDAKPTLGTSAIPDGVLYGDQISNDITAGDVYVNTSLSTASQYHLIATSVAPAASFNGSGNIATLVFNVTSTGNTDLTLQSELADHPEPGEANSEPITHNDVNGSVNAAIPEFPQTAILALLAAAVTVALLVSKRLHKRPVQLNSTSHR